MLGGGLDQGRGVGDLGGDGTIEVVTSFYDAAADQWTTYVLDAG